MNDGIRTRAAGSTILRATATPHPPSNAPPAVQWNRGDRTPNLLGSQLSYSQFPTVPGPGFEPGLRGSEPRVLPLHHPGIKHGRRDLNPQPAVLETAALPLSYVRIDATELNCGKGYAEHPARGGMFSDTKNVVITLIQRFGCSGPSWIRTKHLPRVKGALYLMS